MKRRLVDIIEKIFREKIDVIESNKLYKIDNIDVYFDYSSLLEVMNESQYNKLVEHNVLYRDIKDITDITILINSFKNDYKYNLEVILKFICKETLAQRGYILMYNEDNNQFRPVVSLSGDLEFKPNPNLLSLANRYENGILISTSLGSNVVGLYKEFLPKGTKALMCIPIRMKDLVEVERRKNRYDIYQNIYQRNLGFIYLETDRLFNRFDKKRHELVEALKNILYINLDNYRLITLSTLDRLTGVYTRKYFEIEVDKIINESKYEQKSFGLLMIDLDNFKQINDTYGHRVGDEVLFKVADFIKNNVRKTDIVARYGGEEFVIILKNVKEDDVLKIGEKIRKGIENLYIPIIDKNITISIGISMFPKHSHFKEELIIKADQALYIAKDKGKNRIEMWNPNLTDTLNRGDRLAGIISGNINNDQRNILAILDVLNIVKNYDKKEDIIFEFLGRILETVEAENCSLIEVDNDHSISRIYSRTRLKQNWTSNPYINYKIVEDVIVNKKGDFLIDWESSFEKDSVLKTPNWQSVMAIPLIANNKVKAVGYMTVPIKEKEFDYNTYNLAKILWDIFAFSL
ncbi:MAG: GGDEF domain-containing protein [Tissierellia bacterium]|nr:GGDEF domain-containing protein [Tissierellia bacterium]